MKIICPFALFGFLAGASAADMIELRLWNGSPPLAVPNAQPEAPLPIEPDQNPDIVRLANVSDPSLVVYPPPAAKRTGTAVLVCPGGGYHILAMKHEGSQTAQWLNSLGITAVVLKYRVPAPKGEPPHLRPLIDAQRAMSLIRQHASEWGVDADRVGVLGFSAGGHLAAWLLCEGNRRPEAYPAAAGEASCRPDFGILIYPAYLADPQRTRPAPELRPEEKPGPVFFAHAADDKLGPENSIEFFMALRKAGLGAELHVYQEGGHGFGMLRNGQPINDWPRRCEEWLRSRQLLK